MCGVFLGFGSPSIRVSEDNKGAIQLAKNTVCTSNSERIDVSHHFLRALVLRGEFDIAHVESGQQRADFPTKPLFTSNLRYHRNFLKKKCDVVS